MRIPESLASLAEAGIIEEVVRPLMSGKEAQIFLVIAGGRECVAKVYKEAQARTFKHRAEYTEGRRTRNSRDQRAMSKRTRFGRAQDEAAWRTTEVDMIRRLRSAGVRVPVPYQFSDGVLVMELITDEDGDPAPRLGDVALDAEAAQAIHERLVREVVRMLCAGIVHGDLSDFNVLLGSDGPVIIDFPQAVEASGNANARKLLIRDVDNLHRFLCRFVPGTKALPLAEEMWELYERSQLTPTTELTGTFVRSDANPDTTDLLDLIDEAYREERRRREERGLTGEPPGRRPPRRGGRPPRAPIVSTGPQASQPPASPTRSGPAPGAAGPLPVRRDARDNSGPAIRPRPSDGRGNSGPAIRPRQGERDGAGPAIRPRRDDARGDAGPAIRPRQDDARGSSGPAIRPPHDDARGSAGPAIRPRHDDARGSAGPAIRPRSNERDEGRDAPRTRSSRETGPPPRSAMPPPRDDARRDRPDVRGDRPHEAALPPGQGSAPDPDGRPRRPRRRRRPDDPSRSSP